MFLVALFFYLLFLWSSSISEAAKQEQCPPFPHAILENGKISALNQQILSFQCDAGYFLAAPSQVRCRRGKWSSTKTPRCVKSQNLCNEPSSVANGEIFGDERTVGSVIQYMCNPGFVLLGDGTRTCLESKHWDGITPACMDESEPLQKVADRLKNSFVSDLVEHSTNNTDGLLPEARLLDHESIHQGLELIILIDRSSSVDPEDFKIGVNFVKFLLQEFGVRNGNISSVRTGTRAAVFAFGTEVDILFNLDNETITGPLAANRALDTLQAGGGGTAMEAALTSVFTELSVTRDNAKKAIFLMTDGEPNIGSPQITPEDIANGLKNTGFEIFTMGIGRGINRKLLSTLASQPILSHVFILNKYSELSKIMKMIRDSPPKKKTISQEKCGYIKGDEFHLKKWPWLAAIYISFNERLSFCSGTLICNRWVLSAASCFHRATSEEQQMQEVFVTFGEHNLVRNEIHQLNFYTTQVILHPGYNPQNKYKDNLALLELNLPVPLKKFRPICLPPTDRTVPLHMILNINASIAGWGLPEPSIDAINGGTVQFNRTTVLVDLSDQDECKRISGRFFTENTICAGLGKNTCIGDIGSPIVALDPSTNLHHVLGILNGKDRCGNGFNQYLELTRYIRWINKVTDKCHLLHYIA